MEYKAVKASTIITIILLSLWTISATFAQAQSQEVRRQEVQSRINCVVCKITSLAVMIAIPIILLLSLPVFLLGASLLFIFYDKWKKAKDDPKARSKAKKIMAATLGCMAVIAVALIIGALLLVTGIIGGDCWDVCSYVGAGS